MIDNVNEFDIWEYYLMRNLILTLNNIMKYGSPIVIIWYHINIKLRYIRMT